LTPTTAVDRLGNGSSMGPQSTSVRRVLVIGGAGFVGSVLVRQLLHRGYEATILDALMYGDEGIHDLDGHPRFRLVRGDLRDIEALISASNGADAIVHLGALVGDPACAHDEKLAYEINLDATRTVAAVARGLGIGRFVFASTCSVYGASEGLLDEDSALDPISLYARTKRDSEALLLSMDGDSFNPVVLRFGTFYGASSRARFDLVVNSLVAKAVVEKEITINGGSQWRPFIHVADGAEAIIHCIEAPSSLVGHRVFNVGFDEENYTLADIAAIVAAAVPDARVRFVEGESKEANYRVSFARIRQVLGFQPMHTVADGVAEIKVAIESGAVSDYADARYSNIKSLTSGESVRVLEHQEALAATGGSD
jgi:nucleoside-diphosphate-sugar epimerase